MWNVNKAILLAASCLRTNAPEDASVGICYNIWYGEHKDLLAKYQSSNFLGDEFQIEADTRLLQLFHSWPLFSGNLSYPVPHPTLDPKEGFNAEEDVWTGEYGARRLALLDHIIASTMECL